MKFVVKLIISTLAVLITAMILPGVHLDQNDFLTAFFVAAVLAFLNTIVKPILIILTVPFTIFTLGLFILVINTFINLLAAYLVDGFTIDSVWDAFLFSLILSFITWILEAFQSKEEDKK
jgi:putative membrane protein